MHRNQKLNRRLTILLPLALAAALIWPAAAAAETYRVAVVPFKINADRDLSFLQAGITDMLATRLSWEERVEVVGREETARAASEAVGPMNEIQAQILGAKLEVHYVLYGSLTVFGDSVSIDARMVDVSGQKPTLPFFNQSESMNQVIPKINQFASDINGKVFGRQVAAPPAAAPASPAARQAVADIHAHPEKLLQQGPFKKKAPIAGGTGAEAAGTLNPAFIASPGRTGQQGPEFWKSRNLKLYILGLAVADVDGDGRMEVVLATPNSIQVGRIENNRLSRLVEIEGGRYLNAIGLDAADINGNGRAEIFVTNLNPQYSGVRSFVLEYDGSRYRKIVKNSAWNYRVVELADRGPVLLGQRYQGDDPFRGPIYELVPSGSEYTTGKKVLSSRECNLVGATYGDATNSGTNYTVAFNRQDYIRMLDTEGDARWTSQEVYGGTNLYFVRAPREPGSENRQYLPMRLRVADLDADGKYEVIAVKNHELARRKLESFRKFNAAQIESFVWDGLGLAANWQTRKITGQISDFAIADFDSDGNVELVAAVIAKEGRIVMTSPQSAIIAYEIKR